MGYEIRYEARIGYLFAHIEGPETYDNALEFWKDLRREARDRNFTRLMVVDEVTGILSTTQIFTLSTEIARLHPDATIAFVDPKKETLEANKFGETVLANRGITGRVFTNEEEAEEWLLSSRPH